MIENIKKYYLKYIGALILAFGIIILNNIIKGSWNNIYVYLDSTFISGMTLILVGGLSVCSYLGAYDVFSYMAVRKGPTGIKPSLYEHSEQKKKERKNHKNKFVPYFMVGGLFLIVSIIIYTFI